MQVQRYARLRKYGSGLSREQMSEMVISAVREFSESGSYKRAMILAGRLKAISMMAASDDYWAEQVAKGFDCEFHAANNAMLLAKKDTPHDQ